MSDTADTEENQDMLPGLVEQIVQRITAGEVSERQI